MGCAPGAVNRPGPRFAFPFMQHDNQLTAEQVRANLHLLTLPELLAGVTPLLVVRGKTAGSSVLVLGRDAHFVLDPVVGAHVMRFADYADFRAKEAKIREQVRGKVIVETEFFVAPAKAPVVEREAVVPSAPVDPEAEAKEAATMRWNARWSEREGVLARTLEPTLVRIMEEVGLPPDRYCGKRKMMERILEREKTRALEQMAFAGDVLPAVPEAQEFEELAAANRNRPVMAEVVESEVDTPEKYAEAVAKDADAEPEVIEPAAGMGAAVADNPALWQTMPLAQLRALAAARGIQKTDRRDLIRALAKAQPAGV